MINISRLYCGAESPSDPLRYGVSAGSLGGGARRDPHRDQTSASSRHPVVVWTLSRRCNLSCRHCYTDSENRKYDGELTTDEATRVIDDLAAFDIPSLLLSGGEPLMRPDFFYLAEHARERRLRLTLSTNGTMITPAVAARLKGLGFSYVGISLDGIGAIHDEFRGRRGAYERALAAFRCCVAVGQKVGLRLTLTRHNIADLDRIFDLLEAERIDRACFYHLVPSGRGADVAALSGDETRAAVERIMDRARDFHERGLTKEILTVGNAADGALIYRRLAREGSGRAEEVWRLLSWNGGGAHGSGVGLANIDSFGDVHPDQFWQTHSFGNVREKPFSMIWKDAADPLLRGLRERNEKLQGRCGACRYRDLCGGSFRVRAFRAAGDPWAADPGCYLSDQEVMEAAV